MTASRFRRVRAACFAAACVAWPLWGTADALAAPVPSTQNNQATISRDEVVRLIQQRMVFSDQLSTLDPPRRDAFQRSLQLEQVAGAILPDSMAAHSAQELN